MRGCESVCVCVCLLGMGNEKDKKKYSIPEGDDDKPKYMG